MSGKTELLHELDIVQNRKVWEDFYTHISDVLNMNKVPLDNVFFVNTPNFIVFFSEIDKAIIAKPASDYSRFNTRKVLFEKCVIKPKFNCYYKRDSISGDKMSSFTLSTMTYKLNWREPNLNKNNENSLKALSEFFKSKSHLPIFLYVESGFFDNLSENGIVRIATLDMTSI